MTFYFTLSVLHHLAVFTLVGLLAAEIAVLRERMAARDVIALRAWTLPTALPSPHSSSSTFRVCSSA